MMFSPLGALVKNNMIGAGVLALEFIDYLRSVWHETPGPVQTFLTAAGGALFGAWLSSRAQSKRTIVNELHALRAAHALCFSITNKALALKKQQLVSMKAAYDTATEDHDAVMTGQKVPTFELQLDLRTMSKINFPISSLEKLLQDKCFVSGELIATSVAVADAAHDLNVSLDYRNRLMSEFREKLPIKIENKIALYLGLFHHGAVDDRLRNNLDALWLQTNCCIFFGRRLGEQIQKHENEVRSRAWTYRLPGRALKPVNWKTAEDAGLMPPDEDFTEWLNGFVKHPSRTQELKMFFQSRFVQFRSFF